jgi:hypothetical protein
MIWDHPYLGTCQFPLKILMLWTWIGSPSARHGSRSRRVFSYDFPPGCSSSLPPHFSFAWVVDITWTSLSSRVFYTRVFLRKLNPHILLSSKIITLGKGLH